MQPRRRGRTYESFEHFTTVGKGHPISNAVLVQTHFKPPDAQRTGVNRIMIIRNIISIMISAAILAQDIRYAITRNLKSARLQVIIMPRRATAPAAAAPMAPQGMMMQQGMMMSMMQQHHMPQMMMPGYQQQQPQLQPAVAENDDDYNVVESACGKSSAATLVMEV